jgi:hypothetical protein
MIQRGGSKNCVQAEHPQTADRIVEIGVAGIS